jgi:Fe-S oxidoreductase
MMSSKIIPDWDISDAILEMGALDAFKCYQCGTCMAYCPWSQVDAVVFPVYQTPQAVKLGVILADEDPEAIEREVTEVYRCVGCGACVAHCPHGVSQPEIIRAIRRLLVMYDSYPAELKDAVGKIQSAGNPFGESRERRGEWAAELEVPAFEAGMEVLYSPCCVPAYDPRARKVAEATVRLLREGGVTFGALAEQESCCGEAIRRAGAEDVFQEVAGANVAAYDGAGVERMVVTSPHCYLVARDDYGELGADVAVEHQTELFARLIEQERLTPTRPLEAKVVYHDPCTLGRQSGVYDEPRKVLSSIPGVELLEIPVYNRENSFCCGGGAGGSWLERPKGERMSDIRVQQAVDAGAEILAVACPYCLQMFEDSVKTMDLDLVVKDVAELLAESL